jgi:hypothetical protein
MTSRKPNEISASSGKIASDKILCRLMETPTKINSARIAVAPALAKKNYSNHRQLCAGMNFLKD